VFCVRQREPERERELKGSRRLLEATNNEAIREGMTLCHPRSFVGYLKVNSAETLSIFGDECPQNGSKNGSTAPSTGLGCPHIGPFVVREGMTL